METLKNFDIRKHIDSPGLKSTSIAPDLSPGLLISFYTYAFFVAVINYSLQNHQYMCPSPPKNAIIDDIRRF